MIKHIEDTYSNVNIFNQDIWTYNELVAIANGLGSHIFIKDILSATNINFHRKEFYSTPGDSIAGHTDQQNGIYDITIFDDAYYGSPDVSSFGGPESMANFEGAIIHELAHVAIDQNPSILESYKQRENQFPNNILPRTFGEAHNFALCISPDCDQDVEEIAMTASTWH